MPNCIQPLHRLDRCEFHFVQYELQQQEGLYEEIDAEFDGSSSSFDHTTRRGKQDNKSSLWRSSGTQKNQGKRFLYFIMMESSPQTIKIGASVDPDRRLIALQVASPFNLRMLGFIEGSDYYEGVIHTMLAKYRMRGEWFRYGGLVKEICTKIESGDISDVNSLIFAIK